MNDSRYDELRHGYRDPGELDLNELDEYNAWRKEHGLSTWSPKTNRWNTRETGHRSDWTPAVGSMLGGKGLTSIRTCASWCGCTACAEICVPHFCVGYCRGVYEDDHCACPAL